MNASHMNSHDEEKSSALAPESTPLAKPGKAAEVFSPAAEGTIFTCPMHPEIRRPKPGNCPKCGMALEPEMSSSDDTDNPELVDFKRSVLGTVSTYFRQWKQQQPDPQPSRPSYP